jgi:hypothetical protein
MDKHPFDPSRPDELSWPYCGVFSARAPFLSTAERDAQDGHDTCGREGEATKMRSNHNRELDRGMNVVLDHDLETKRHVVKKRDQKQDHQDGGERSSQPNDERRVVAPGVRDDRGGEPQR